MAGNTAKDEEVRQDVDHILDFSFRSMRIARHSRVNSSMTLSMRNLRPLWVRSSTKSYDQTWFGRSGRSRMHDPSPSQSLLFFGCLLGTFSPSRRHIRSTRFTFTAQPAAWSIAVIRR
jgi:hypothetical protein